MSRVWSVVALFAGAWAPGAQAQDGALARALQPLVREAEALGVRCGVDVRVAGEAGLAFSRRALEAFVPASNMKILTAAHVVRVLGLEHEFVTRFALVGGRARPVLRVYASGDPTLSQLRLGDAGPFDGLATALRARGVRALAGVELVAPRWSGPARPASWPRDQLRKSYAAPTGPFVLEEGCCVVALTPRSDGQRAKVELFPRGAELAVRGRLLSTRSRKKGGRPIVSPTADGLRLSGSIWTGFGTSYTRFADEEPELRYRAALRAELAGGGIRVGEEPGAGVAEASATPSGAEREVWALRSGIAWALRRMLEDSSNFQAEQLARVAAAHEGGEASLAAARRSMQSGFAGLEGVDVLRVLDASGLSRGNRIAPRLVTAALERSLRAEGGRAFLELFPRAGHSGTIARRMTAIRGRVRAKTGWIRGASSLSGVVLSAADRVVFFSILMNYDAKRAGLNKRLKALQDRIVERVHASL